MFRSFVHCAFVAALISIPLGCSHTGGSTKIQLQHMDETRASYGDHFRYMVDNAILADMSLADIHFVAHTTELSGIGAARLQRMAKLLNAYGGKVRYETTIKDKDFVAKRIAHVRKFLALSGCEVDQVEIGVMAPRSRGMSGQEGVAKYQRASNIAGNAAADTDLSALTGN